jgi:hypothetical protein
MRWVSLVLAAVVWLSYGGICLACDSSGSDPPAGPPLTVPSKTIDPCAAKLESQLFQLVAAADPAAFASQIGIPYENGSVRVIITVGDGQQLSADPAVQVEGAYADRVQAQIAPADICQVALKPEVVWIEFARPGFPQ